MRQGALIERLHDMPGQLGLFDKPKHPHRGKELTEPLPNDFIRGLVAAGMNYGPSIVRRGHSPLKCSECGTPIMGKGVYTGLGLCARCDERAGSGDYA